MKQRNRVNSTPATKQFLIAIETNHNKLQISLSALAEYLDITRRGVMLLVDRLSGAGVIAVLKETNKPNTYSITTSPTSLKHIDNILKGTMS